ncbi:unnamed protein product [Acanthoscelides obtectus]|uniref:Uncharacterized protein n=1 Tax=Acanthoscelides obtectus TaxID=200917 RepID=A0A9P0NVV6_ACAOB|nr:unnamed protein product [Acanthoscelides obtectus]CAK1671228.1 hypothetical protein AOBTE_LOCUS28165 [Acanthoscelides obtectus]
MDFSSVLNTDHREILQNMLPTGDGFEGIVLSSEPLSNGFSTKEYHCIHNTKPKRNTKPHEKHLNCNAKMIVTIKNKEMKRSNDVFLKKYPCEIFLRNTHNHSIYISSALKFCPPSQQLQEEFKLLFTKGHSPSTAYSLFKDELYENHNQRYNEIVADGSKCPTLKWVYDLYYQIFKREYGEPTGVEMIVSMENAIKDYNIKCESGGNRIGVQPTAIMRRKSGLGGRNIARSGRPPKRLQLSDHAYSKEKNKHNYEVFNPDNKTAAPHCLEYCITQNISLATGGRKVPSALHQATSVTVSAFSAQATDEITFDPFTAKTSPGLIIWELIPATSSIVKNTRNGHRQQNLDTE